MSGRGPCPQASGLAQGRARVFVLVCLILLSCLVLATPGRAASTLAIPTATDARLSGDARQTRFIADLSFAIPFNVYVLADPFRVVIDLPEVDFKLPGSKGREGRGLVRKFRFGRMSEGKSRIVLDVDGPVLIRKSYILHPQDGLPARLVVDLVRTDRATFAALVARQRLAAAGKDEKRRPPLDVKPLRSSDPVPEDLPLSAVLIGGWWRKPLPMSNPQQGRRRALMPSPICCATSPCPLMMAPFWPSARGKRKKSPCPSVVSASATRPPAGARRGLLLSLTQAMAARIPGQSRTME